MLATVDQDGIFLYRAGGDGSVNTSRGFLL